MVKVTHQSSQLPDEKTGKTEELLQKMKEVSIEETTARFAASCGLPYIDLSLFPVEPEEALLIPEADARRLGFILFQKKGLQALFAITDPANQEALSYIDTFVEKKGFGRELYVVSKPSIESAWEAYTKQSVSDSLDLVRVSLKGNDLEQFEKDFGELISLKENRPSTTSHSIEVVLAGARKLDASDIHLEPEEDTVRLRYRVDGVLQNIGSLSQAVYRQLISRIKMIGKMRLNIRDKAQDGHFFITLDQKRIDVRVNIIPGKYGESINMRLLSGEDVIVDIDSLGLRGLAREEVLRQIEKPNGMVLNTGPTGSGKTTTLYTLLNIINQPGAKIITVEDPIEYSLPGIVQTEVSKDKSYTFASALRAIVRQDPDIILIGEIRDDETADIAVNAALTGHLVMSTLHANSAPGAIPRFIELGVKPSVLAASVNVLIAQRLVRKLCDQCKQSYEPAKGTIDSIIRLITIISPKAKIVLPKEVRVLWKASGCPNCHFTGYKGRIGIFEVFAMTPDIIKIIENLGTEQELFRAALENGMVTMTQDGILKMLDGITTLEEISRVTDQSDMLKNIYLDLMSSDLSRSSFIPSDIVTETARHLSSFQVFEEYVLHSESKTRLQIVFAAAIHMHAGDIHIEPSDKDFSIRLRIDGMLQTIARFPLNEYPSFINDIKNLVGLKTSERAGITDKRFSIAIEQPDGAPDKIINVRLSLILGGFGETAVIRLLNQSNAALNLENLALRSQNLKRILSAIHAPNGIILNTGPTGSGKTTTLYGTLALLNKPETKIITVEDPIEYQMPGILQTQINEAEGYTFSTALSALLRQNPDVLMVGEIRDDDTARIAIQAANTGHLVLSTLHANSAAGAISRLMKMGISGDDIANAGGLLIAQRLVRRLCEKCKQPRKPTDEEHAIISKVLSALSPEHVDTLPKDALKIWSGAGCQNCNGTGHAGQLVLSETIPIDNTIKDLIARGALTHEIEEKAIENGMITIAQDGILSVIEGKTSLDEVRRVANL